MLALPVPVADLLHAYADAVRRKDAPAFAALYAEDVVVYDSWDAWQQRGAASVLAMAREWFGSLGSERVEVSFSETVAQVEGAAGFAATFVTYTALSADGRPLRSMNNRMSLILRLMGGQWRVVHQHSSLPVSFGSMTALPLAPA